MLKKLLIGLAFLSLTIFITGCTLPGRKKSALSVSTTPQATIFLDGEHLGQTPYYNEKLKPGDYVLKIVPESSGQALNPWEGRVTLSPGILTVVNRELGLTQDESSGEILSFETSADKNATSISVVTTPDGAVVNLDGEPKGFAPISLDNTTEGDHLLLISSPGYQDKTIKAKTVKGNKLIVSVQLARAAIVPPADTEPQEEATPAASPKASPTATPKASPKTGSTTTTPAKPYIEITSKEGWARVRDGAGTKYEELTIVDFGEKFPLLDTSNGWYKIEYEAGKQGWVSGALAEKYE